MRIAYFNGNMRPGQDGVTRVMYKTIDEALACGHEAIGFSSDVPPEAEQIIPTYRVPSVPLPLQKAYRIAKPGYSHFAKRLTEFRPDILHINSPCTLGFGAMRYARDFGVPIVATYHTHFPTYPRYYKLNGLEEVVWKICRKLYNNIDRTFVPAEPILHELQVHGIERLEYVPNGVDTETFNPKFYSDQWRKKYSPEEKPIVLFVSRLVWEKNLQVLADMYSSLKQKRNDFEMVVVGDGHARADLEKIMPAAQFLGFKSGKELSEAFASSDVFVFPSTTETFGLVTLEAMASGLVPVAAKYGGAVGIIKERVNGLFSAPRDAHDLARNVEILLDNPDLRSQLASKAISHAQTFAWENVLKQLFTSYEEVIRERKNHSQRAA